MPKLVPISLKLLLDNPPGRGVSTDGEKSFVRGNKARNNHAFEEICPVSENCYEFALGTVWAGDGRWGCGGGPSICENISGTLRLYAEFSSNYKYQMLPALAKMEGMNLL
jgi:hypothetical protein